MGIVVSTCPASHAALVAEGIYVLVLFDARLGWILGILLTLCAIGEVIGIAVSTCLASHAALGAEGISVLILFDARSYISTLEMITGQKFTDY